MVSGGIGAATLRALTPVVRPFLADQCLVEHVVEVPDGAMGITETYVATGTYACYVEVLGRVGGQEADDAGRVTMRERFRISFLFGAVTLHLQDRITQLSSGTQYLVTDNIDTQTSSPLLAANAVYASK
jgi:hypothetical protein